MSCILPSGTIKVLINTTGPMSSCSCRRNGVVGSISRIGLSAGIVSIFLTKVRLVGFAISVDGKSESWSSGWELEDSNMFFFIQSYAIAFLDK